MTARICLDPGYYESAELREAGLAQVGENVLISRHCNIVGLENIEIGDNVRVDFGATIIAGDAGVRIGSFIHIGAYCYLSGGHGIELGDFANLSQRVSIYTSNDDYTGGSFTNPTVPAALKNVQNASVLIGAHAILGSGAIVLPGADLGEGTAVGALSLIRKPAKAWTIYAGVPAKPLRARPETDPDGRITAHLRAGNVTAAIAAACRD